MTREVRFASPSPVPIAISGCASGAIAMLIRRAAGLKNCHRADSQASTRAPND